MSLFIMIFIKLGKPCFFCIGNPIVNLMDFEDFEVFSIFFQDKMLYRKSNSKFPNFMAKCQLFGKIKISHRIFYQKPSGFLLRLRKCILFLEIHSEHSHSLRVTFSARIIDLYQNFRVYCMELSFSVY